MSPADLRLTASGARKGSLILVNRDHPSVPAKLGDRGIALGGDLGENLRRMAQMI